MKIPILLFRIANLLVRIRRPKHYIIEIKMFAIANTTRRPDQNTPKQETHGALVVVLAVRGDAAHN